MSLHVAVLLHVQLHFQVIYFKQKFMTKCNNLLSKEWSLFNLGCLFSLVLS